MGCWHAAPSGRRAPQTSLRRAPLHPGSQVITLWPGAPSTCEEKKCHLPTTEFGTRGAQDPPAPGSVRCPAERRGKECGVRTAPRGTRQLCPGPCRLRGVCPRSGGPSFPLRPTRTRVGAARVSPPPLRHADLLPRRSRCSSSSPSSVLSPANLK